MMKAKKRFIAGAVCPQCQQQDSLALLIENQAEIVRCVACGYQFADRQLQSDQQIIAHFPLTDPLKTAK